MYKKTPADGGSEYIRNHEIDIEIPGYTPIGSDKKTISFNTTLLTYYQGINGNGLGRKPMALYNGKQNGWDEFISNAKPNTDTRYNPGKAGQGPDGKDGWRIFAFEWHTDKRSIQYYIDGVMVHSSNNDAPLSGPLGKGTSNDFYVPFLASRFNIAAWFPYAKNNHWSGEPLFNIDAMLIDYVRITPYDETIQFVPESSPEKGFAPNSEYPKRPR